MPWVQTPVLKEEKKERIIISVAKFLLKFKVVYRGILSFQSYILAHEPNIFKRELIRHTCRADCSEASMTGKGRKRTGHSSANTTVKDNVRSHRGKSLKIHWCVRNKSVFSARTIFNVCRSFIEKPKSSCLAGLRIKKYFPLS
jgi:hypothetical protein